MTPEQIERMQAGRQAAAEARQAEKDRLANDEHAAWLERHHRAYADLLRSRQGKPGWQV